MKIKNRSASVVGYKLPDSNVRRRFVPGEVKDISEDEIKSVLYQAGGRRLFENYLQLEQDDLNKLEEEKPEQEYFYTEDQIKTLMTTGSLDEFLDMLDFAPSGVIDLVKSFAVSLPMTDLYKIKALKDKTGFDAAKALENTTGEEEAAVEAPKRRVTENKYKVISDK